MPKWRTPVALYSAQRFSAFTVAACVLPVPHQPAIAVCTSASLLQFPRLLNGTIIISTNPMSGDEPGTFALEARVSKGLEDIAGLLIRYLVGLRLKTANTELNSACKNAEGPGRQDSPPPSPPPPTPPPLSPVAVTVTP
uniref:Uncharacterized protein n=1 Tax=Rhipicephalus zambeziensis TaxID=60191 RepID=A0A224Y659_9ACAR